MRTHEDTRRLTNLVIIIIVNGKKLSSSDFMTIHGAMSSIFRDNVLANDIK